jgi:phosphatidylserine/phosphatidylglycerophosphate/cardiolipin synthase-like enzyme
MDFKLINTEEIHGKVLTLIREARERVTLVSPYVSLGTEDRLGRAIQEALSRKVKLNVFIRWDDQTPLKQAFLEGMLPHIQAGLGLYTVPGLHAKLYWSESTVILTSLNLLASSVLNSIEAGLCLKEGRAVKESDAFLKREIAPHASPLHTRITGEQLRSHKAPPQPQPRPSSRPKIEGHCIRCGGGILLNPSKPYCRDDYEEWAEWSNEDYKDSYCHACGDDYPATMARPLCRECYRQFA